MNYCGIIEYLSLEFTFPHVQWKVLLETEFPIFKRNSSYTYQHQQFCLWTMKILWLVNDDTHFNFPQFRSLEVIAIVYCGTERGWRMQVVVKEKLVLEKEEKFPAQKLSVRSRMHWIEIANHANDIFRHWCLWKLIGLRECLPSKLGTHREH